MAKKGKNSKNSPAPQADLSAASAKKKGKGKKNSASPDPIEVDQNSKRQANRAKITSTASWTGKLPHTLLHEFCQKRRWNRVEYDMKKIGDKGMLAVAVLSCTDPKTNETFIVRMNDPTYDKTSGKGLLVPQETPMEARHFAATVALYRLAYNTNMHMMLPPNHKNLWYDLRDYRNSICQSKSLRCQKLFDNDPFKTLAEEQKLQKQRDRESEGKDNQSKREQKPSVIISLPSKSVKDRKPTGLSSSSQARRNKRIQSLVSFPRKVWENATFIDLDESSRQMIESNLKINIDWISKRIDLKIASSPERDALRGKLLSLNFREVHVEEAMSYKDPLSFLLFNLPEDDLPPFFHKRQEDSKNVLEISALPLAVRNMIDRLMESGVSKDEALLALESSEMKENEAAGKLTEAVYPQIMEKSEEVFSELDSTEIWNQELESLKCIYEDSVQIVDPTSCYTIDLVKELKLKLKVYRTRNYPASLPGIIVSTFDKNYKLPNYIKQQILTKLLLYIFESHLLGEMLVFHIYEWLQENLRQIIENPGPLLSEFEASRSLNNKGSSLTSQKNHVSSHKSQAQSKISKDAAQKLKEEYFERLATSEYKKMLGYRANLPAWRKEKLIVDLVEQNDVVLITGETGSGKSTQVVQFLLDFLMHDKGDFAGTKIICTQPRRISAIGLAERVADERCVECGDEVGYIIRGVNRTKATTRIKFMTTGVLVRILQSDQSFLRDSIVVIDEVHERSIDTDLIVILLKSLLGKIPNLKIVLMSATVNVDVFKNYFGKIGACHIEGRTFPIRDYFLDEILESLDFKIKSDKFQSYSDTETTVDEYLRPSADCKFFRSGQINYDLVCQVVCHIDRQLKIEENDGSIIVFLPGVAEISKCCSMLLREYNKGDFTVLPLHSALTPEEQRRVFKKYTSKRKIVVSTNIAETSITIDDCVATIDTGRGKTMIYNPKDNTTRLTESFISKAEVKQRRGRAGRVREGVSYKLFSRRLHEEDMVSMPDPEIKRASLESLYISVKAMGIKDVGRFLGSGLDPPPAESVDKAGKMLTTVGLLDEFDGSLTQLGKFISLMPTMDSKHGKLLIYSIIFGVADWGILLASILSVGSMPFIGGMENRDKIKNVLSKYEGKGDLIALAEIIRQYMNIKDGSTKSKFMRDNLLSYNKVKDLLSSHAQYHSILKDVGFLPFKKDPDLSAYLNRNNDNFDILKAVIMGAFYPHVARVQLPDAKYLATSVGAIEKDPEAKAVKLWIRNEQYIDHLENSGESDGTSPGSSAPLPSVRAFIHPSSVLFTTNTLSNEESRVLLDGEQPLRKQSKANAILRNPFIAFNTAQVTNKLYLRDITPTSTLSLLLLGGPISYNVSGGEHSPGIVVDNWLPVRTWCKNAVLLKELRTSLDQAIKDKLENPRYATGSTRRGQQGADKILNVVEQVLCLE